MGQIYSPIDERERYFVVGRDEELRRFRCLLDEAGGLDGRMRAVHVYGTGGVGKSTLLRVFRNEAQLAGAHFLLLDSRDFVHTEQGIAEALLRQTREQLGSLAAADATGGLGLNGWLEAIGRLAKISPVVVAFDTFEEMADMENWLRERLFAFLPERTIALTAGRHPLQGVWTSSPAWREKLVQLPLRHLNKSECGEYLTRLGSGGEEAAERIWRLTKGHPLAMSLAAAAQAYMAGEPLTAGADWFEQAASLWMREVPDQELRNVVEAASVLRHFNQEMLSFVMEEEVAPDVFDRLTSLSFVHRSDRGWRLHDLMRETTSARLKLRLPNRYKRLCERGAGYYADAVWAASGRRQTGWEVGELFRYVGADVLRALSAEPSQSSFYWEPVTETTLSEAAAYIHCRQHWTESISGAGVDPETGASFRIEYSAEEIRWNVALVDVRRLFELDKDSIKLLRDQDGRACGIAVFIPFHEGTVEYMEKEPICGPYLAGLKPEDKASLHAPRERPAGWFMRVMDFEDVLDPDMRKEAIDLIYAYLCSGGIVVCSPYPSGISRNAYPGFGFCTAEHAYHFNYDGKTATPTYVLDTRGDRLRGFLESLFQQAGLRWQPGGSADVKTGNADGAAKRKEALMSLLTKREKEVAELVLAGFSNSDAASRLFISEVTVKKHLKAIYAKLGVHSRMQLAGKLMTD
ncbi:LuxR C-terminal-related transcriptional regulator [Paenibacillus thailandensis]|uniref:LuxR C-terminal-related transcriptional regulator n=1 Tax=Paenibacillus thailandensis TaxID=393250 RepID=A0ABW5QWC3_9BACL